MKKVLSYRRVVLFACWAVALVAVYFIAAYRPQHAQERTDATDPLANYKKFARRDAITDEIRSRSKELVRVEIKDDVDRAAITRFGNVVQDFGSFAILSRNKGSDVSGLEVQKLDGTVHLPGAAFDPIVSPPAETTTEGAKPADQGKDYYVVQFGGLATDELLNSVRETGAEILQYLPQQAFFIYADSDAIGKIAAHSRVRWVGKYLPEHRIPQVLKEQIAAEKSRTVPKNAISRIEKVSSDTAIFDVAVFSRADMNEVAGKLSDIAGSVKKLIRLPDNFFNVIRVEMPVDRVTELSNIPDVVRIDAWGKPQAEDERAAQIVSGNYTNNTTLSGPGYDPLFQFGVDGTNVTLSVVDDGIGIPGDGGFYISASNAVDGPLRGASIGANGHGHLNASIIAGDTPFSTLDAASYSYGKGIAPKSNVVNIPLLRAGYTGVEADCYNDTITTAGPNTVLGSISNNSWGADTNGNAYDGYAAMFDGFVRDASAAPTIDPLTLIFSAGNSGSAGLTRPKIAKNIIAVGNSENLRPELSATADNIDDLSGSSSRGPAADGRIKPDIIAPGTAITGGRSGTNSLFGNVDQFVRWSTGTSHAAPQVAGAAALFTQYWKFSNLGKNPSPAMIKAAILNTGQEMNGVGTSGSSVPNGNEGWGRMNMKYMIDRAAMIKWVDQTVPFTTVGNSYTVNGSVSDPSRPVRVALVWTDPPGAADPALVNNLDLSVTVGGTTYRGNVLSGGTSVPGGSFDTVNNVEMVRLPAGIAQGTPFSISVSAAGLNGDGILGNSDTTDQNFALVAYNFNESVQTSFSTISGQVVSQGGRGIGRVMLTLTGQDGIPRYAITNPFGYFSYQNVAGPQTYTISPSSKRYGFASQQVTVNGNLTSLTITSLNGAP